MEKSAQIAIQKKTTCSRSSSSLPTVSFRFTSKKFIQWSKVISKDASPVASRLWDRDLKVSTVEPGSGGDDSRKIPLNKSWNILRSLLLQYQHVYNLVDHFEQMRGHGKKTYAKHTLYTITSFRQGSMEGQWVKYRGIPSSFMSSGKNKAAGRC